jgi:hypothetical protein
MSQILEILEYAVKNLIFSQNLLFFIFGFLIAAYLTEYYMSSEAESFESTDQVIFNHL